jgi:hypothetical protein
MWSILSAIHPFRLLILKENICTTKKYLLTAVLAEVNEYPVLLYNHSSENVNFRVVKTPEYVEEGQEFYFKFGNVFYPQEENSSSGDGFPIVPGDTLQGENGFFAYFNPNSIDSNQGLSKSKIPFFQ